MNLEVNVMAILTSEELSLEIIYCGFEYDWIQYEIYFRWQGEHVINDAILKRRGEYWGARPVGSLLANEHRECCILPVIKRVIETNEPDYCEPVEPDIILAIYPEQYFPFLPSHMQLVYEREDRKLSLIHISEPTRPY